ncbi:MAG TPA: glycine cleavage system aminomethyltransferase GcvT [Gemmatimonadaceae bacterium]|nr:glycine cleavage system aminomethyltransferase GcvT [Gemmatimonadaceae bacterium]
MSAATSPTPSASTLKRTPLHDVHRALNAKIVPFAGYEMPVQYATGITAEHKAVRDGAGLFDVSHMGEFVIRGERMVDFVNYVTTNDVAALAVGQVQYSTILYDSGTIVDDCLVYRFADRIIMVVNASNREKDFEQIRPHAARFGVQLVDISDEIALLALQGPNAEEILRPFVNVDLAAIKYYWHTWGQVRGMDALISRTGYTGEDGFELYVDPKFAAPIWNLLMGTGKVTPAGLGARDTLRLEMGMALYGNDIDDSVTPLEANLGWLVKLNKEGGFVGRDALARQKERGLPRRLVGFTVDDNRSIARHGYPVYYDGMPSGEVRSGTMSPSLGVPIGTAYLPLAGTKEGSKLEIDVRGKRVSATVVRAPFYKKASHK